MPDQKRDITMEKILLYTKNDKKRQQIQELCEALKVKLVLFGPEEFGSTIGSIAAGKPDGKTDISGVNEKMEIMVFCKLAEKKFDQFLKEYKARKIEPIPLKAVETPTNTSWTVRALSGELLKEMLFFQNRK